MQTTGSRKQNLDATGLSTKGALKRDEILAAARKVLVEEGNAALTARRIARELQVGLSHVQYYYPSRDLIVKAILEQHLELTQSRIVGDGQVGSERTALNIVLKDQKSKESCRIFWELWALSGREGDVGQLMHEFHQTYVSAIAPFVEAMNPALKPDQVRVRAVMISALLEGLSLFRGYGRKAMVPATKLDPAIFAAVYAIATSGEE